MPAPSSTPRPFEIVRLDIETVTLDMMSRIRNAGAVVLRRSVRRSAPGPVIVRFLSICNSLLVRRTVVTFAAKLIVSPDEAPKIACRKEPGPLSFPFVTVMVAAVAMVALNNSTPVTQERQKRQHLNK